MKKLLAAAVVATVVIVAWGGPVAAEGTGYGWVRDGDLGANAGTDGGSPGSGGGGGSGSGCTYTPLDPKMSGYAESLGDLGFGDVRGVFPGAWFRKVCPGFVTVVWIPVRVVDPAVVAQQAFDQTTIPLPGIGLSPPVGVDQVVNIPTWLWVDAFQPVSATASVGSVSVTVTARPVRVDWSMGNGESVTCPNGGTPYDRSRLAEAQRTSCSYTYRRSSASRAAGAFSVRATSVWRVTWAASGVSASGDFGLVSRSTDVSVRVAEIQTLNG